MTAPVRRPETMAMILATVSGFVDAFIYLRVYPVFTANQSGNLILAGIALGEGEWAVAAASLVALASYIAGAGIGVASFDRARHGGRRQFLGALGGELAVLTSLLAAALLLGRGDQVSHRVDGRVLAMIAVTSLAMGLQGVALRRVHGVRVLTTGGTGNVTSIGEGLARLGIGSGRTSDELALGVIGGVVLVYVLGAILGAAAARTSVVGPILVVVPIAAVATAILLQRFGTSPRR